LLGLVLVVTVKGQNTVPVLAQHVMDLTNSLTYNEWRSLEDRLKRVKDTTRVHIAVLVVDKLKNESLESYATKVFTQNQLGSSADEPGILIAVEKDSKSATIHLGIGLADVLTKETAEHIVKQEILPLLIENNFYGGLAAGVLAITAGVVGHYEIPGEPIGYGPLVWAAVALVVIAIVVFARRKKTGKET
jgi:uncharacterized protein